MKKRFLIPSVLALGLMSGQQSRASGESYQDVMTGAGIALGATAVKGCFLGCRALQTQINTVDTARVAAAVGGHLTSAAEDVGKLIASSAPFVTCVLSILKISGVDVRDVSSILSAAVSASTFASLIISQDGIFTSVKPDGTSTTPVDTLTVLLSKLTPTFVPLCTILVNGGSYLMPVGYTPDPSNPDSASWPQSQKILAFKAQLLSIYIQGSITAEGPNSSGLVTLTSSTGSTLQINGTAATIGSGSPFNEGYITRNSGNFIKQLSTGDMSVLRLAKR